MSPGVDVDRMATLDRLLVPLGGVGERYDVTLGRRVEHATAEALGLWALLLVALAMLAIVTVLPRAPQPGAPPAGGWTLGDLLGVVLGSYGAAAVLVLALARLHPARAFGAGEALLVHVGAGVLVAVVAFPLLLRRAALRKHGLGATSPSRARLGAALLAAALVVATGWVGPGAEGLALLAAALLLAGALCSVWAHRVGPLAPELREAVLRYQRRVALSSLGLALVLVCALDLAFVRGRRLALTDAHGDQLSQMFRHEGEWWGGGQVRACLQRLLAAAPDRPADWPR